MPLGFRNKGDEEPLPDPLDGQVKEEEQLGIKERRNAQRVAELRSSKLGE
jgi:hypothetical protein